MIVLPRWRRMAEMLSYSAKMSMTRPKSPHTSLNAMAVSSANAFTLLRGRRRVSLRSRRSATTAKIRRKLS